MYMFASLLGRYRNWIDQLMTSQAILAPLALLFVTEMGIPIFVPNDLLLAYAGFGAPRGNGIALFVVFVAAMAVVLGGSSVLFLVGQRWGKQIVDKLGKFLFIQPKHIEKAQQLLERYGAWAIIIGRHIAGVRVPLTIFAAASGVKFRTFFVCTFVTTAPWVYFYVYLGNRYGATIQHAASKYTLVSIIVIVALVIIALALHWRGTFRRRPSDLPKDD